MTLFRDSPHQHILFINYQSYNLMCTSNSMYYKLLICTHILQLLLYNSTLIKCAVYKHILHNPQVDYILIPKTTHHSSTPEYIKFIQRNTQPYTVLNSTQPVDNDVKTTPTNDSTTTIPKSNQSNDSTNATKNMDNVDKLNTNNDKSQNDTTNNKKVDEKTNTGSSSTLGTVTCVITFGFYCPNNNNNTKVVDKKDDDTLDEIDVKTEDLTPVESKNCFEYGKPGVVSSDWAKPEELGWIVVNELGVNRFTSTKPANSSYPPNLLLDKLECNAASYEIVLKLGSDSIGGLVFRASTDKEMAVVLNTSSKTISLSKNENGGYQTLYEKSHQGINSQFLHKLGIIDSGYKGQIQVLLDGEVVMNVPRLYFNSSGGFGLHVEKGNVSFSEASVEPL